MDTYSRLKQGMAYMWSLGDYSEVAPHLARYAEALADRCGLRPGMRVLDVAAGNGNFSLAAARRGCVVTATDVSPRMLELGQARTAEAGAVIEWSLADAEDLPFEPHSFDVVASVFGAMFAPGPERVAEELFRVVRPGGTVALAAYGEEGFLGRLSVTMRQFSAPAPIDLPSPFLWGNPDVIRRRLGPWAESLDIEVGTVTFAFDSDASHLGFLERTNPALALLRGRLAEDAYLELRGQIASLIAESGREESGRLRFDSSYAWVVAHTHS